MAKQIEIKIYRSAGEWFGARTIDGEYDGCDALDCGGDASESDARAEAESMPLAVDGERVVRRVADVA